MSAEQSGMVSFRDTGLGTMNYEQVYDKCRQMVDM